MKCSTYFCRTCGIVRDDAVGPPICRHGIGSTRGPAPARMVPLPKWHPLAKAAA